MTAEENYITFSQNLIVLHSFSSADILVLPKLKYYNQRYCHNLQYHRDGEFSITAQVSETPVFTDTLS